MGRKTHLPPSSTHQELRPASIGRRNPVSDGPQKLSRSWCSSNWADWAAGGGGGARSFLLWRLFPQLLPPPTSPQTGRQSCQASPSLLPFLFPPVSPDLSASVFSPSLCLTGSLSPSRHSRRRLRLRRAGTSRQTQPSRRTRGRGPRLREGGKKEGKI